MGTEMTPTVGEWYRNHEGDLFEVVAVDQDDGTVEIQYFEGELEELDQDTWDARVLESAPAPEDWTGPFDDLEQDDLGDVDLAKRPEDWSGTLFDHEWDE